MCVHRTTDKDAYDSALSTRMYMTQPNGFVKLNRGALCAPCFKTNPYLMILYVHLCAMARWRDNCVLKAGELFTSLEILGSLIGQNDRKQVQRYLQYLQKYGLIKFNSSITGTKITIVDFCKDDEEIGRGGATPSATPSATPQNQATCENNEDKKVPYLLSATPSATPSATYRRKIKKKELELNSSLLIPETETAGGAIELAEVWNSSFPHLRQVTISILRKNEPTKKTINAAIKRFGYDHIMASFELIKKSPWLMSRHDDMGKEKKWLDLLWVLKPSNYQNIWDEKYLRAVPSTSVSKEKWL